MVMIRMRGGGGGGFGYAELLALPTIEARLDGQLPRASIPGLSWAYLIVVAC